MPEFDTKHFRYYLSYLLRDLPVGAEFDRSELHITVLPWFALETDEKPFTRWFYKHFDACPAFEVKIGEQRWFGPKKDVPVNLIEPKSGFLELHKLALSWFGAVGARWAEKDPFVGNDYLPHVAQRHGFVLKEGDSLLIDSLSLFRVNRRDDHGRRTVVAKAELHA